MKSGKGSGDKKDDDAPRKVTVTCPACRGSGVSSKGEPCAGGCNGTGKITAVI